MASIEEVSGSFEQESNHRESIDYQEYFNWSELPSRPIDEDKLPTYALGEIGEGKGTLQVRETSEIEDNFIVVYNFISEGELEPVSTVLGRKPEVETIDLPYNTFDSAEEGVEYAEALMNTDIEEVFEEYGVRVAETRNDVLNI